MRGVVEPPEFSEDRGGGLSASAVRRLLHAHGLRPRKRWGQHFLVDAQVAHRIVDAAGLSGREVVVEVGAGLGALTTLLGRGAARVLAVERDPRLCVPLRRAVEGGRVEVRCAEIQQLSLAEIAHTVGRRVVVVGNLPYYITTEILEWLLHEIGAVQTAVLTVQAEVAGRIGARPGTRAFGALSCFVQFWSSVEVLCRVAPGAFWPPPKVASAVVRLVPTGHPRVAVQEPAQFFAIVRAAFGQRRKMVANALEDVGGLDRAAWAALCRSAGVEPASRPEQLRLEDFAALADAASAHGVRAMAAGAAAVR